LPANQLVVSKYAHWQLVDWTWQFMARHHAEIMLQIRRKIGII